MSVPASWMPSVKMQRIIVHWTAGAHKASALDRSHYHVLIEGDGRVVRGTPKIGGKIAHTLNCNTGSIGVSLCCMGGGDVKESPFNAGKWPLTRAQWEQLPLVLADLCRAYGIAVGPKTVLSHAEVESNLGIKQRGKWDIARLAFDPAVKGAKACGDLMRRRLKAVLAAPKPAALTVDDGDEDAPEPPSPPDGAGREPPVVVTVPAPSPGAAETEVKTPEAAAGVRGDPELWHLQRRLKARNYNPGGLDGAWGDMTASAIAGFINGRKMGLPAPTSPAMLAPILEPLKDELARAEAEGWARPVSVERANADAAKVEQAAPEIVPVKRNIFVQAWAAVCAFFVALWNAFSGYVSQAWNFFTEHKDDLPDSQGWFGWAWEKVTTLPLFVWLVGLGIGLLFLLYNSKQSAKRITEAVQSGERP